MKFNMATQKSSPDPRVPLPTTLPHVFSASLWHEAWSMTALAHTVGMRLAHGLHPTGFMKPIHRADSLWEATFHWLPRTIRQHLMMAIFGDTQGRIMLGLHGMSRVYMRFHCWNIFRSDILS